MTASRPSPSGTPDPDRSVGSAAANAPQDVAPLKDSGLARGLKNRHLQMIAMGSCIGTGLFLGSGASVQLAGPVALLGYVLAGAIIFLIMRMLGEMAVAHPIAGSFSAYAREFIGPVAGFVAGWNWWFTCIVVGMLELTASATFMDYWFPGHPHWVTVLVALLLITAINLIHVGAFGEAEFWMSLVKVAALIGMIVLGIVLVFTTPAGQGVGVANLWNEGGFAPKGVGGFLLALVPITFAFGGIVSIGTAAGEAETPERTIPKAINAVPIRVLLFYVGGVGIMLLLSPWTKLDTAQSPFVRVLAGLGIDSAATVLNVVILAAALSVFNTMTYSGARMLRDLAASGQAPPFFAKTARSGVPVRALLVNALLMGGAVLLNWLIHDRLFAVLMAIIVGAEIISWSSIALSHLRFRMRQKALGEVSSFRSPLSPAANIVCLVFFALILVLMGFLPDYRTGLMALPLWIIALVLIWTGQHIHQRRSGRAGAPVDAPAASPVSPTPTGRA